MHFDVVLKQAMPMLLEGLKVTIIVSLVSLFFGMLVGLLSCLLGLSKSKVLRAISAVYVWLIRGTPMMVQLLIMGFVIFSFSREYTMIGALTLGINSGAYVAEIMRGGILSVDSGQMEAGRAVGLSYFTTMMKIVVPQAIKNILPALCNEFISTVKGTSLASVFFVGELMTQYKTVASITYLPLQPLVVAGIIYFVLNFILSRSVRVLERRLMVSD